MSIPSNQTRPKKANPASGKPVPKTQDIFTSQLTKGVVLVLILVFNVLVFKKCFLMVAPQHGFSGDLQLDGLLYGIAMALLMVIILFHEEDWHNVFCPGAITLYVNTLILIMYTRWFEWLIGAWGTLWLMRGLLTTLPVLGLFILVIMLKNKG